MRAPRRRLSVSTAVKQSGLLASTGPVHGAASAHVLAADSDYSLVKELRQEHFRDSRDTPATALAVAFVWLPNNTVSRVGFKTCVSFHLRFPVLGRESYRVVFRCQPPTRKFFLTRFRVAVATPPEGRSRCIGEPIIGSLTDFQPDGHRRFVLARVRKKKRG